MAISEKGTNMTSLYHFTDAECLYLILSSDVLMLSPKQRALRGGGNFISFTRHKSNLEGFARARDCNVRIEIYSSSLNSFHGGDVSHFEYYSPKRVANSGIRYSKTFGTPNVSAKEKYANAMKSADPEGFYAEEYLNQAEESYKNVKNASLPANKVIKRVDVCVPDSTFYSNDINMLLKISDLSTPLCDKIFVYDNYRDFNLQTTNCLPIEKWAAQITHQPMKIKKSYLYKMISEAILKEMDANKLDSKLHVEQGDGKLKISFGKNGWGLTDEFLKIHNIISEISKSNNVYLTKVFVDTLDDVYDFEFSYDNEHFDD